MKKPNNYFVLQSSESVKKKPKKMNILLKILIIFVTLPFLLLYPFFFIFRSKKINLLSKFTMSFIYLIALSFLSLFAGSPEDIARKENKNDVINETSLTYLELTQNRVEIFQGQLFDPKYYVSTNTSEETLNGLDITNPVHTNEPGEYVVIYTADDKEERLVVTVLEDPITLSTENLYLDLGDEFNPIDIVESKDMATYDIKIENLVDLSKPGVYSVNYSFKDIKKSINVTIKEPNTIDYLLADSEWLLETTRNLGFTKNVVIEVDGGDMSGTRQSNVVVDVGFDTREYWAFTNNYGQLVAIIAEKIILQDESTETLLGDGRYYADEANVPGTEKIDLDNGHVIADSLGGVSNAYNITPQNSNLNRNGDQAYMEEWIQKANGAEKFIAIITYPNTTTQIPSHYSFSYIINGNKVTDEFDNKNPEAVVNNSTGDNNINTIVSTPGENTNSESIEGIDKNGNGIVTIAEAKAAGFKMPIHSTHWLYKYMVDGDHDGMVGE